MKRRTKKKRGKFKLAARFHLPSLRRRQLEEQFERRVEQIPYNKVVWEDARIKRILNKLDR